jgi:HEAT repeat protein
MMLQATQMSMRPRYRDLFSAMCDSDPYRADAAYDAVLFDRSEALPDLAELYRNSPREPKLRFYAIQLMGFTEDSRAIPMVMEALTDHDPTIRAEACRALEDLGAVDALEDLRDRVEDLDPEVRRAAREATAAIRRRRR